MHEVKAEQQARWQRNYHESAVLCVHANPLFKCKKTVTYHLPLCKEGQANFKTKSNF